LASESAVAGHSSHDSGVEAASIMIQPKDEEENKMTANLSFLSPITPTLQILEIRIQLFHAIHGIFSAAD
jgi:hypothetical protein